MQLRIRYTTQVCTCVWGRIWSITSGSPLSPSQQTMSMPRMPQLRSSVSTASQNRAPSFC